MPNVHVVVIDTGKGCIVVPGKRVVRAGDTATFTNLTGDQIDLSFPVASLWSAAPAAAIADGDSDVGTVNDPIAVGDWVYSVYCHVNKTYADGGSHPAFIVR